MNVVLLNFSVLGRNSLSTFIEDVSGISHPSSLWSVITTLFYENYQASTKLESIGKGRLTGTWTAITVSISTATTHSIMSIPESVWKDELHSLRAREPNMLDEGYGVESGLLVLWRVLHRRNGETALEENRWSSQSSALPSKFPRHSILEAPYPQARTRPMAAVTCANSPKELIRYGGEGAMEMKHWRSPINNRQEMKVA